jgi:ParB family chromosome partitioning protein
MDASAKAEQNKPRRLGRGLTSLLGVVAPVEVAPIPQASNARAAGNTPQAEAEAPRTVAADRGRENELSDLTMIPVEAVDVSPFQPRRGMDDAALGRLAESIRRSGVLQPVLVRPRGGRFELVAGERRWRAAQVAGVARIPALVRELTDEQAAEQALVENVQREDLNPMERAWALRSLGEKFGLSHAALAERVGLERPTVANLVRLTELEPEIAGMVASGVLTAGHGRALLAVGDASLRRVLAERAAREEMSVRALEKLIQAGRGAPSPVKGREGVMVRDEARIAVLADLQRRIGQQLGTKVLITTDRRGKRGRISMEFYGLDHFDALMTRLGVSTT